MRLRNLTATVAALLVTLGACADEDPRQSSRQEAVAERGASVMPFDLEKTTHRFLPTDDGLRQEVVADHPDDTTQVDLVRQHLTAEAERFRSGDFEDPASIHGDTMPGLTELSVGAADIEITYADLPDGATLTFRTPDPELIQALHDWGEAQISDHGSHAETGKG